MKHNSNFPPVRHKVLLAPLDWGLGHATRCIPIVEALLLAGHEVWLASDGAQAVILQEAFPDLPMLSLPGYGIRYSKKFLIFNILVQMPRIVSAMQKERAWLTRAVETHRFSWVVSDNRYGLHHAGIRSTLITHQLSLSLPKSFGWGAALVNGFIRQRVNKFSECWVPDVADDDNNLSGMLGHPATLPSVPVSYIGWLSRFKPLSPPLVKTYQAAFLLSGPEPQRTMFEDRILKVLAALQGRYILVRGLPLAKDLPAVPSNTEVHNHLTTAHLQQKLLTSRYLISRSGYSTLMDAQVLALNCIFVPTPGQTEQEYLAAKMMEENRALAFSQDRFDLEAALKAAEAFGYVPFGRQQNGALRQAIDTPV